MIHPNLVLKTSHSSFDILFSLPPLQMCIHLNWLCHQSITTKPNLKRLSPKIVMAPIIHKKICNIFQNVTIVTINIQIHMPCRVFFFLFENLHKCEKKYEKRIFGHFFFGRKKSLDLQKIKNHIETFPYWFWFGKFLKNV